MPARHETDTIRPRRPLLAILGNLLLPPLGHL